jgi:anti-sigma factor RsiW
MNDQAYQKLIEKSWRRRLTPEEEAAARSYLQAHPQAETHWRSEQALNRALDRLADVPVSSNFTQRVLQALEADERRARAYERAHSRWRPRWFTKAALAGLVVSATLLFFQQQKMAERAEMARSVAAVSNVAQLPPLEWLEDFEAIHRLSQVQWVDEELVALLVE